MTAIHEGVPGRPRKVTPRRSARVQQRVSAFQEGSARFVDDDRVVRAAASGESLEALYIAREELAREAASLLFDRLQATPGSRELGRLASRRTSALRDIANLTVAIARAGAGAPSPERMGRILVSLMEVVDEAAVSVLPADTAVKFQLAWHAGIQPCLASLQRDSATSKR
jgi:hypothetical protein